MCNVYYITSLNDSLFNTWHELEFSRVKSQFWWRRYMGDGLSLPELVTIGHHLCAITCVQPQTAPSRRVFWST